MNPNDDSWNYFQKDPAYSEVLRLRLSEGVEMDSAKAMGHYLDDHCRGDLDVLDFGGGPGHYFPVIKGMYSKGQLRYKSVDIDAANVAYGRNYFGTEPAVALAVGSVLSPEEALESQNCIISANTLPHVPSIEPLLDMISRSECVKFFAFRMLIGTECVQIKKHLAEADFDGLFDSGFQFNNIYSRNYIEKKLGARWRVRIEADIFDVNRLADHRVPEQERNPFYGNRVSRPVSDMVFKGDIYMPWKFVLGSRVT